MSTAQFVPIANAGELSHVFSPDDGTPKVVFLDDPSCPISAAARRRVSRFDGDVLTIDVSRQGDLSRQIATLTGVQHESPQAFVVANGVTLWNASHQRISEQAIKAAIARMSGEVPAT